MDFSSKTINNPKVFEKKEESNMITNGYKNAKYKTYQLGDSASFLECLMIYKKLYARGKVVKSRYMLR